MNTESRNKVKVMLKEAAINHLELMKLKSIGIIQVLSGK